MPRWMLKCPKCSHNFTHTKIEHAIIEEPRLGNLWVTGGFSAEVD